MKLADEMLLAQMRESVLQDVPEEQWNLVVDEVEKAGGVRQVQGYTRTLIYDAITKASFGGNRSEAGRYAANVRWQDGSKADRKERDYGSSKRSYNKWANSDPSEQTATVGNLQSWIKQGFLDPDNLSDQDSARLSQAGKEGDGSGRKAWKGATEERLIRLFHRRYFDAEGPGSSQEEDELFQERGWLTSEGKVNPQILERGGAVGKYPIPADATFDDKEAFDRADAEELKEGNLADDLPPSNMPPLYNDYGDEPVNPMPPEYNDYGDEPGDDERAGAKLREAMVPLDTKNPLASRATKTPDSPSKRIALEVKNASQKNDAAKVVDSARQDAEDAETDLFRAEKDGKSVAGAEKNFAETKALFESAKQAFKERFGSEKMPYQGM